MQSSTESSVVNILVNVEETQSQESEFYVCMTEGIAQTLCTLWTNFRLKNAK